jgi:hypothetical protein
MLTGPRKRAIFFVMSPSWLRVNVPNFVVR